MASARDFPGLEDDALRDYIQFLRGQYRSKQYEARFEKVRNFVLEKLFDLKLFYKEHRPDFFTRHHVEEGPAKLFIDYIPDFSKRRSFPASALLRPSLLDLLQVRLITDFVIIILTLPLPVRGRSHFMLGLVFLWSLEVRQACSPHATPLRLRPSHCFLYFSSSPAPSLAQVFASYTIAKLE